MHKYYVYKASSLGSSLISYKLYKSQEGANVEFSPKNICIRWQGRFMLQLISKVNTRIFNDGLSYSTVEFNHNIGLI